MVNKFERVQCNIIFKYTYWSFFDFPETFIQREVVPDTVLPASGGVLIVREMINDPAIDVFDWQCFDRRVFDGHKDQTRK